MDVRDAFRHMAVEWDGCAEFGNIFGDFVVVDRRSVSRRGGDGHV